MSIVYLSGKITGDPGYLKKFVAAQRQLEKAGYKVINPASVLEDLAGVLSYDQLLEICFKLIDMSDSMALLPDWTKSRGAGMEYGYAKGKGKHCEVLPESESEAETDVISSEHEAEEQPKISDLKIDTGKIRALYNAGWSVAKIADEMNLSKSTIYRALGGVR